MSHSNSRREAFTIAAMQALITSARGARLSSYEVANKAVKQADALIAALDRKAEREEKEGVR